MPYLSASAVVIHYEQALYPVYAPLPLPRGVVRSKMWGGQQAVPLGGSGGGAPAGSRGP